MSPQHCLRRYEFWKAPKSILRPPGNESDRAFKYPSPESWKTIPDLLAEEIEQGCESFLLPSSCACCCQKTQPKYILTEKAKILQELGYKVYEHCSNIFDPVVVRKIPFNGPLLTVSCSKVPNGMMQITARLMSGRQVFCKEYPGQQKVRASDLRVEIRREIIELQGGSCNSTFHLILAGRSSHLKANTLIGLSTKSPAFQSNQENGVSKKNRVKQNTSKLRNRTSTETVDLLELRRSQA